MSIIRKTLAGAAVAAVALTGTSSPAFAQETVQAIVPFGAGGGTDRWARIMSSAAFDVFDAGMRIQNRGGASGTIGWKYMLDQGPDGISIMFGSPTPVMAALLEKNPPFDPINDVKVVAFYSVMKPTLLAPKDKPYNSYEKLIEYLKTSDEKLTMGGTLTQALGIASILDAAGVIDKVTIVTYDGTGDAMNDYLGGHIHLAAVTESTAVTVVDEHNTILNASSTDYPEEAKKILGDVPNAKSLGYTPYNPPRFIGMHPDTPPEQVKAMSDNLEKLFALEQVDSLVKGIGEVIEFVPHEQAEKEYREMIEASKKYLPLIQ